MISLLKLSKRILILFIFVSLSSLVLSEPKDIWKQSQEITIKENQNKKIENSENNLNKDLPQTTFDKEKLNLSVNEISQSEEINDQELIFGLYEPEDTKINLNFWSDVDNNLYSRVFETLLNKEKNSLVAVSEKVLFSKSNINVFEDKGEGHLSFIADWLINNQKMKLIDQVIDQNKIINKNAKLLKFLFTHYLSLGQIDKACSYTKLMTVDVQSIDLEKYKIFCLINNKKIKQAQSQLELTRETSSLDNFFVGKVNFLTGISDQKSDINFDNVFYTHLTLMTNDSLELKYNNFSKSKELRNYFFKSNLANKLLDDAMKDTSPDKKKELNDLVIFLERSVNEDLYPYKKILDIYKKYNFSFNQLFQVEDAVKNLRRPESHAILYQAMLLAQKPDIKLKILNNFKDKLTVNGLEKIAEPVYYLELEKIYSTNPDLIDQKIVEKIKNFKISEENKDKSFNNNYFFSSEIKKLLDKKLTKKDKKKILNLLEDFDKKIKEKSYKLTNKDIALINILDVQKIDLPKSMSDVIYNKEIYIPNEIFNSIEKKLNDEAILKTLLFIADLDETKNNYTRDILAIIKIFDNINLDSLKTTFINSEFSL
ncbi:MAG: hypothetical protein MRY23_06380 [Pelagibacteraceae bacterium]|nr:hypothetical protein [Pelagibacteraceae bacterium]MCI5078761.1 hypothetical protein [Pelagibacteraceae bacterium]